MASGARQTTMIVETAPGRKFIGGITHGKSWKIKLFQKPIGRIAKTFFMDHIFMQSFCSSQRHSTSGKSFSVLFITDLNIASLVERSLTAARSHILSASELLECWQNLSKLTNHRVSWYTWNDLLLSLSTGVLSLNHAALFYFFRALFSMLCPS